MKEISIEEMKQVELDVLREFHKICVENGFHYSIVGGTLIGAVRHKGFIPWDDDIDVTMTRPEYEKFKAFCKANKTGFDLICNELYSNYGYLFPKLANPNTMIIDDNVDRYELRNGVGLDIFIYDGMGNTREEAVKRFNSTRAERELLVAANWKRYFRSKTHAWYYEPARLALYIASRPVNFTRLIQKIEKKYEKYDFNNYKYVGNLCSDMRARSILPRNCFDDYVELDFEGEYFMAMKGYKEYLTTLFGDYMQLPPVEKRVTHHTFKAYWK